MGTGWRSSCWAGKHEIEIDLVESTLSGEPVCDNFDVIATVDQATTTQSETTTKTTTTTTAATTTTTTTITTTPFECGSRIQFDGFIGGNADLNGLWTLAMKERT